jgi:hypothetical protein
VTITPPGWYPAPENATVQRWWDGTQWTEHYGPVQQVASPQLPAKKGLSGIVIALIVVVVAVPVISGIIGVAGLLGAAVDLGASIDELSQQADESELEQLPVYNISDRPGWNALVARYDETYESYSQMADSDEIFTIIPATSAGIEYYRAFMAIMFDQKSAFGFMELGADSTDPQELDDRIVALGEDLTELERKFLANEDLGVSIRIVHSDGTVFETESTAPGLTLDQAVAALAAYTAQPDGSGSYYAAGQEMLGFFGMQFTWADGNGASRCTTGPSSGSLLAYYCHLDPWLVYLNQNTINVNDDFFSDVVRHELAHHIIAEKCSGSLAPPMAGDNYEGVTSSFAILYLGATSELSDGRTDEYATTSATDAAASQIYDGFCG